MHPINNVNFITILTITVSLIKIDIVRSAGSSFVSICDCSEKESEAIPENFKDPFYVSLQQDLRSTEVNIIIQKVRSKSVFVVHLAASTNPYLDSQWITHYMDTPNELLGEFERISDDRYCPNSSCKTRQSVRVKWRASEAKFSGVVYFYIDVLPFFLKKSLFISKKSSEEYVVVEKSNKECEQHEEDKTGIHNEINGHGCENVKDEQQNYEGVNFNTIFFSCAIIVLVLIFGSVVKSHFSPGNDHANDNQDFDFNGERNVMDELPPSYSELFGESN